MAIRATRARTRPISPAGDWDQPHPISVITYGGRLGYQAERKDPNYVDAGDTPNTEVSIFDYGDKCIVFETRGLSVENSADEELNKPVREHQGQKVGVVFYGTEGFLVQGIHALHRLRQDNVIKQFEGGGDHFGNFLDAVRSRKAETLNADAFQGHLSAAVRIWPISVTISARRTKLPWTRPRPSLKRPKATTTTSIL